MWKFPEQDLEALIAEFERSSWREMRLRMRGTELILSKDAAPVHREVPSDTGRKMPSDTGRSESSTQSDPPPQSPVVDTPPQRQASSHQVPQGWTQVRAPTLGTFYRSPKPDTPAFVEVGSHVTPQSELCLVEVMKLFTSVRSPVHGSVREIYAKDGELVEFDQPLFLVEPHG